MIHICTSYLFLHLLSIAAKGSRVTMQNSENFMIMFFDCLNCRFTLRGAGVGAPKTGTGTGGVLLKVNFY